MGILNADGTQDYDATLRLDVPVDDERRQRVLDEPLRVALDAALPGSQVGDAWRASDETGLDVETQLALVLRLDPDDVRGGVATAVDAINSVGVPRGSWLKVERVDGEIEVPVGLSDSVVISIPDEPGLATGPDQTRLDAAADALRAALSAGEQVLAVQGVGGQTLIHVYSPDVTSLAERMGRVVDGSGIPGAALLSESDHDGSEWVEVKPG